MPSFEFHPYSNMQVSVGGTTVYCYPSFPVEVIYSIYLLCIYFLLLCYLGFESFESRTKTNRSFPISRRWTTSGSCAESCWKFHRCLLFSSLEQYAVIGRNGFFLLKYFFSARNSMHRNATIYSSEQYVLTYTNILIIVVCTDIG